MTAEWAVERVPQVGQQSILQAAAAGRGDAWAFGISVQGADRFGTLVFRRRDQGWRRLAAPSIGRVNRAIVISDADVWAVGDGESLHWDGLRWHQIRTAVPAGLSSQLFGLARSGDDGIWAAGYASGPAAAGGQGTVQRWDGRAWTAMALPDVAGEWGLAGISAVADDDVWAVGHAPGRAIALHWDGRDWDQVPVPIPEGRAVELRDVIAVAGDDVVAGGWRVPAGNGWTREPIAIRWNGTAWSPAVIPDGQPATVSQLVQGNGRLWGIGSGRDDTGYVVRSSGLTWEPVPGPRLPGGRLTLHSAAVLPGGQLLVVGATSASSDSILPFAAVLSEAGERSG